MSRQLASWAVATFLAGAAVTAAAVDLEQRATFSIPAQSLSSALLLFAEQSKIQVLTASGDIGQMASQGAQGQLSLHDALTSLLEGTGLVYREVGERTITIGHRAGMPAGANKPTADSAASAESVRVAQSDAAPSAGAEQASPPASAPENTAGQGDAFEVVVTGAKRKFAPQESSAATKIPMEIIEIPQSISVLSSELMSIVGANTINKAMEWAPSVTSTAQETSLYNQAWVRGFSLSDYNSYKLNGMAFTGLVVPLDLAALDSIEIVRGPSAIIYGDSDYGGTVNVRLKKPQATRSFSGSLGGDVHGSSRLLADATGALTADGRLRGRLSMSYGDARSPQDLAYARSTTVAPSLSWDITDRDTLDVNLIWQRRPARYAFGFGLTESNELPEVSRKAFVSSTAAAGETRTKMGLASFRHRFGESWALTASGLAVETPREENNFIEFDPVAQNGDVRLYQNNVKSRIRELAGELTLMGDFNAFGRSNTLALSASTRRTLENYFSYDPGYADGVFNVYEPNPSDIVPLEFSAFGYDVHGDQKSKALSGMLLLHPLPRLTVLMGLRRSQFEVSQTGFFDRSAASSYENHAVNKRLGVVFEAVEDVNLYASYSDGTKPNFYTRTASGGAVQPENGIQLEAGIKAALFDKKLTLASAVFQIDRKHIAVHDPSTPPDAPFSITIDGQKHKGVELEAIGEPIPGFNIMASYTHLDVQIDMCARVAGVCTDPFGWNGHQQPNSPKNLAKLYASYQILGGPLRGLSLGGGVIRSGEREVEASGLFQLPAYTRVDARIGYDALEHVSFSLNAINLTDEDIYTSNFSYPYGGIDYQDRRTVLFDVSFKY